jgi:2-oxoisovalerate dehydrogenase E1 component
MFGKAAGPSGGRDGGVCIGVPDKGTLMVAAALPDAYPVAVGWALAFAQRAEDRVAMANCGEGATAAGTWHEAVNLAAVMRLPVVFTVQNNQYAFSTPNEGEFLGGIAQRADGYGIPGLVVDGNDVLDCYAAARAAVERARSGDGPTLIEAVTFRQRGHHAGDPAGYVDDEQRERWLARDPIAQMQEFLEARAVLDEAAGTQIHESVTDDVDKTLRWAEKQPEPERHPIGVFAARADTPAPPAMDEGVRLAYRDALRRGLDEEMERDERVFVIGQDVRMGGPFGVTEGLVETYGPMRVVDAPVAEAAIVGAGIGAALAGRRPVVEVQHSEFLFAAMGQLVGQAARRFFASGESVPLVVRAPAGAMPGSGPHRSLSPESMLALYPGMMVVVPSTPALAKGLLSAAVREPNPVILLEPVSLYAAEGTVPDEPYETTIGSARVARSGGDVTVVAWGGAVPFCLEAAEEASRRDVSVEVIDLLTLAPIDWGTVLASVRKTARLAVVDTSASFAGIGAETVARVADESFWDLDAPVVRIMPPHTPVPYAPGLEEAHRTEAAGVLEVLLSLASI